MSWRAGERVQARGERQKEDFSLQRVVDKCAAVWDEGPSLNNQHFCNSWIWRGSTQNLYSVTKHPNSVLFPFCIIACLCTPFLLICIYNGMLVFLAKPQSAPDSSSFEHKCRKHLQLPEVNSYERWSRVFQETFALFDDCNLHWNK